MATNQDLPDPTADPFPETESETDNGPVAVVEAPPEVDDGEPVKSMQIVVEGIERDDLTREQLDHLRDALIDYFGVELALSITDVRVEDT